MKLPSFLLRNRLGTYYLRYAIGAKFRVRHPDIPKEIRASLNTAAKCEALRHGCALYADLSDLILAGTQMSKLYWEGKEVDAAEWLSRQVQRLKAEADLKKARNKKRIQSYYDEAAQKLMTDEEKRSGVLNNLGSEQPLARNHKGRYHVTEVVGQFIAEKIKTGAWTKKTEDDYRAIFGFFLTVIGDRYFDTLNYDDLAAYKKAVLYIPKNWKTSARYKDRTIEQIMEMKNVDTISNKTRTKHFSTVKSLFLWALQNGKTEKNYASGLKIDGKKSSGKTRDIFTKEELQKIISGDEYKRKKGKRHKKAAYFWVPLIGMFTGARLNEICQLKVADIQSEDGIWYFSFNDEDDKNIKTEAGIRKVPIHKMLVDLGFLRFVKWQRKNKAEQLFSGLTKHPTNGYGAVLGRWFNSRYLVRCGVKNQQKDSNKKVFHSYWHTLIHHFEQRGVSEKRYKAIIGHAVGDLSYYGHGYGLKTLADEVIAKIDYGLDFSHLRDPNKNEFLRL